MTPTTSQHPAEASVLNCPRLLSLISPKPDLLVRKEWKFTDIREFKAGPNEFSTIKRIDVLSDESEPGQAVYQFAMVMSDAVQSAAIESLGRVEVNFRAKYRGLDVRVSLLGFEVGNRRAVGSFKGLAGEYERVQISNFY